MQPARDRSLACTSFPLDQDRAIAQRRPLGQISKLSNGVAFTQEGIQDFLDCSWLVSASC